MKQALLQYPTDWNNLLNLFEQKFTKPQFKNFCQATTCIAVSCYASINQWCKVFDKKHQSNLNDFFTESTWVDNEVHTKLSRITTLRIKDANIGIIDDTFSHKPYAKKMANLGIFYDGLTKKRAKGHSIVTHGLHSHELDFVPLDIQLYKKDGRSKNDIACAMIERTNRFKKIPLYIVDSWYSNNKVLGKINEVKSHYITEIKSNRNVTINYKCRYVREHGKHIDEKKFTKCRINESLYRFFQTSAFISGLGNVNLVFSQKYEEKTKIWGEFYYLITDVLHLSGEKVIEFFLLRGGIEGFHREAKQQLGLELYQLRKCRGTHRQSLWYLLINSEKLKDTFSWFC